MSAESVDTVNSVRGSDAPWRTRAATVALAVTVAAVTWGIARGLGVPIESPTMGEQPPAAIGLFQTMLAALVAATMGWGLLTVLERRWPARASQLWAITASVVFVGSLAPPLTGEGIATATRVGLVALHAAVAAVIAGGLLRPTPRRQHNR